MGIGSVERGGLFQILTQTGGAYERGGLNRAFTAFHPAWTGNQTLMSISEQMISLNFNVRP